MTRPHREKISAGILIISAGQVLLCHATKRVNDTPKQFDGSWTISKGMVEEEEEPITAAIRELQEETSIDLTNEFADLSILIDKEPFAVFTTSSKKTVMVYVLNDEEGRIRNSGIQLSCPSLIKTHDVKLQHLNGSPEMDAFMWVNPKEALNMVFKSQRCLFQGEMLSKLSEHKES